MYRLILICFFVGIQATVLAKSLEFTPAIENAFKSAQQLNTSEAKKWIGADQRTNPANQMYVVIESYLDFFKAFAGEDAEAARMIQQHKSHRIQKINDTPDSNPLKKWALATIYLHSAASRSKFGDAYSAALELRKAYFLLNENEIKYPSFVPNKVSLGFLTALLGGIPPQYQWVLKLASMDGDVIAGTNLLYSVVLDQDESVFNKLFRTEALFFLTFIEANLNPDKSIAEKLLIYFTKDDEQSPLMMYAKANLEMRTGKNDDALKTLHLAIDHQTDEPLFYLHYIRAEAMLRKLDFSAQKEYDFFLIHFKGTNYKLDARRKLAWIDLLKGDSLSYLRQMKQLHTFQSGQVESDKQALREASLLRAPDSTLLKARLLFDGGYFARAEAVLSQAGKHFILLKEPEKLEYYYRTGRIKHAVRDFSEALRYYQLCIAKGRDRQEYYAANAALFSGEIYLLRSDSNEAKKMFELCLTLKPEEYSSGIHAKARAGLTRIRNVK